MVDGRALRVEADRAARLHGLEAEHARELGLGQVVGLVLQPVQPAFRFVG